VAEVIATVLVDPARHVGKVYELTGPRSEDMQAVAAEYSEALGRAVTYVDEPFDRWRDRELRARGLPEYVEGHLLTMAKLHAANRYDRLTHGVETVTGRPATSSATASPAIRNCSGRRARRRRVDSSAGGSRSRDAVRHVTSDSFRLTDDRLTLISHLVRGDSAALRRNRMTASAVFLKICCFQAAIAARGLRPEVFA
jgi:hypothetical protein